MRLMSFCAMAPKTPTTIVSAAIASMNPTGRSPGATMSVWVRIRQ